MFPLFTTAYSFKSILQLKPCDKKQDNSSIVDIVKKHNIKEFALVEENMTVFKEARDYLKDFNYYFGVRFDVKTSSAEKNFLSKIVVFMKDMGQESYEKMVNFYSSIHTRGDKYITEDDLQKWKNDFVFMIPFYDSFLQKNIEFYDHHLMPEVENVFFAIENNDVVFDSQLGEIVTNFCNVGGFKMVRTKTIYYENNEDVVPYVTYRCITGRKTFKGSDLTNPNLEDFSSNQFSVESFLKCQK